MTTEDVEYQNFIRNDMNILQALKWFHLTSLLI